MRAVFRLSEWLYGVLLRLYPKRFRTAYGQQMRQTFRDACRVAYRQNGGGGVLALWLPTLLDLVKSALEERAQQGEITMFKARLVNMAGPLTMLVGVLWLLACVGDFMFRLGAEGNEAFLGLIAIPFFLSFVPLLFALIGIRWRFHQAAGSLGRIGLALSVASLCMRKKPTRLGLQSVCTRWPWKGWGLTCSMAQIRAITCPQPDSGA